jgi:hypothetical protein
MQAIGGHQDELTLILINGGQNAFEFYLQGDASIEASAEGRWRVVANERR